MFAQEYANCRLLAMALSGVDTDSSVGLIDFLLLLLLLSGDIELNPGPTINDKPKNIRLLIQWIEPINDWQTFGKSLPGISEEDITTIKRTTTEVKYRKIVLIVSWLLNPKATWGGIIKAFTKIKEKTRAEYIEYCLEKSIQQFESNLIMCI